MAITYNPSIVSDGLVFYLDAANIKSYPGTGTGWADVSPQSNLVTLINGPTYNTETSPNISFDGTDDRATDNGNTAVKNLMATTSFSFSFWAKFNSTTGNRVVFGNGDIDNLTSSGYQIRVSPNIGLIRIFGYDAALDDLGSVDYSGLGGFVGTWNNFVYTNTSSTGKVYRNGSLLSTTSSITSVCGFTILGNTNLTIGTDPLGLRPTNMNLAVLTMYNKTLSDSEVLQNFNALRGRFGI